MTNKELIEKFYTSFSQNDVEGMVSCYHPNIEFEDPAFGKLEGERAKSMWRMLLSNGKGEIKISFSNVTANDISGSAQWKAEYVFSQTGRKVINNVSAVFEFKDGKISKHTDSFDLYKWSKQAMGLMGFFLGWTSFYKKKLQQKTNSRLTNFMNRH